MKISSILSMTATMLAAAASQSVEASSIQAVHYGGEANVDTGAVHAAAVAQARQQLAELLQRNRHESETNVAQRYAKWLREQAVAAAHPVKQPSRHPHKQSASDEGSDSDSDSGSGSGSGISAHHAGLPHPHPHKRHKQHKEHGHHRHFHHSSSASDEGSDSDSGGDISEHHAGLPHPHPHEQHKGHGHHHHFHHSSSASGSGSDSGVFVAEVAAPHTKGKPASVHHLNTKHEHPTKHETAELHAASGSSSSSVDVDSEDSDDVVFPPSADMDSDDVVFPSSAAADSDNSDDSDDVVFSASPSSSSHAGDDTAGHLASTLAGETPVPEASSLGSVDASVEIKPHLPKSLRRPEHLSQKATSEAATELAESKAVQESGASAQTFSGYGPVFAAVGIVAGVVGVIVAAVGFRRVRRSDARYGASELIVDLPDPESVGTEDDRDGAAPELADAPASTTNALEEADATDLLTMQSPYPRTDEVGEFTNA